MVIYSQEKLHLIQMVWDRPEPYTRHCVPLCVLMQLSTSQNNDDASFGGIGSVPGVGIGTAVVVYPVAEIDAVPNRTTDDVENELVLFRKALWFL